MEPLSRIRISLLPVTNLFNKGLYKIFGAHYWEWKLLPGDKISLSDNSVADRVVCKYCGICKKDLKK